MRIAVAIASVGRAELLKRTLPHTLAQTRPADRVLVVGAEADDVAEVAETFPDVEVRTAPRGLPCQRNAALDDIGADCDAVIFFDDDFLPSRHFLARTEEILTAQPRTVVLTGRLIDDGINKAGIPFEDAVQAIAEWDARTDVPSEITATTHAYGCNMVLRTSAAPHLRFDERLPLYAWQEDRDISARYAAHGRIVRAAALSGVHLGIKSGRQSGVRLGYSQIANPLYLVRKRTMPAHRALALAGKNVAANMARAIAPEPWVDRAGRLKGNMLAIRDALQGKAEPERILSI